MKYTYLLTGIVISYCTILNSKVIPIKNQSEYESIAPQSVIMVTTSTCEPCQLVKPHYTALSDQYSQISFYITESNFIRTKFNIRGFPTVLFLQNGKEVGRFITGEQNFTTKFTETVHTVFGKSLTTPSAQTFLPKQKHQKRKRKSCR